VVHHRVGVSAQSTLSGAKRFNISPAITTFTHRHTGLAAVGEK